VSMLPQITFWRLSVRFLNTVALKDIEKFGIVAHSAFECQLFCLSFALFSSSYSIKYSIESPVLRQFLVFLRLAVDV
jgi:hypothetical protein